MKINSKKTASFILAIFMFTSIINSIKAELFFEDVVYASSGIIVSGKCGDDVCWTLTDDGVLTVSGKGDMYSYLSERTEWYDWVDKITRIVIEEGVTSIGDGAFKNMYNVISVVIPSTVVTIGFAAFSECFLLLSVKLPDSLEVIGGNAFIHCRNISEIVIPSSVTIIDNNAFAECSKLKTVSIGKSVSCIGVDVFSHTEIYENSDNWVDGALYIDDCLIGTKSNISSDYTIKEGTRLIAGGAFSGNPHLLSVTMPNSLLHIGVCAFERNENLTSITFSDSLLSIGSRAFSDCSSLESVVFPETLKVIDNSAFSGCDKLDGFTFPDSLEFVGGGAFYNTAFYKNRSNWSWGKALYCEDVLLRVEVDSDVFCFEIKNGTKIIASSAVSYVEKLEEVVFPDSVKYICSNAFQNCEKLKKMTLPDGLEKIHSGAFYGCDKLKTITVPESVTLIEDKALGYRYDVYAHDEVMINKFVINGVAGSEAQKYATENEIAFVEIESSRTSSENDDLQSDNTNQSETNLTESPSDVASDENSKANTEIEVNKILFIGITTISIIVVGVLVVIIMRKKSNR